MNSKSRQLSNTSSLKNDIENMAKMITNMSNLQANMKKKLIESEQFLENKAIFKSIKENELKEELKSFRSFFQCFSDQCKNQWITVYKELLEIIHSIVDVYQIKIGKLQSKIDEQQSIIDELYKNSSPKFNQSQKLFTQSNENDFDFKALTQCSEESMQLSNSKKIKISDVIASYQSSILTSHAVEVEPNEINISLEAHNKSIYEKSFQKGSQNAIDYDTITKFHRNDSNEKYQLSLAASLSKFNSKTDLKMLNSSLDEKQNMPSFVSSCRKLSQFQESRRDQSKSGRSKNKQYTQSGSASKLSELRKYLYSRKRM